MNMYEFHSLKTGKIFNIIAENVGIALEKIGFPNATTRDFYYYKHEIK